MIGDQVYLDNGTDSTPNVWKRHLDSDPDERKNAMAEKYQENWSQPFVSWIFANIPTYMIWDDHDIRDGWGSLAPDSPTLASLYSRGKPISTLYNAYFEDARNIYWHFQMCRNPAPYGVMEGPPPSGMSNRAAMPFAFQCGRIKILMLDNRGDRDLWRPVGSPVLGPKQWEWIEAQLNNLPAEIDAIVIITPVPIVSMAPTGQTQNLVGHRTDDVELFKRGDRRGLSMLSEATDDWQIIWAAIGGYLRRRWGMSTNLGSFRLSDLDDARDQWSNHFGRPEQEKLIRLADKARNRPSGVPRGLIFLGGDLHAGGIFEITSAKTKLMCPCLVSSGISKSTGRDMVLHILVDEEFEVASGIRAKMREFVNDFNFGVVHVIPTGGSPQIIPTLVHKGSSSAWGIRDLVLGPFTSEG